MEFPTSPFQYPKLCCSLFVLQVTQYCSLDCMEEGRDKHGEECRQIKERKMNSRRKEEQGKRQVDWILASGLAVSKDGLSLSTFDEQWTQEFHKIFNSARTDNPDSSTLTVGKVQSKYN